MEVCSSSGLKCDWVMCQLKNSVHSILLTTKINLFRVTIILYDSVDCSYFQTLTIMRFVDKFVFIYRYGLLGSSGCGKTTVLKCIAGSYKLDSGTKSVLGNTHNVVPPLHIGFMPQVSELIIFKICWNFIQLSAQRFIKHKQCDHMYTLVFSFYLSNPIVNAD